MWEEGLRSWIIRKKIQLYQVRLYKYTAFLKFWSLSIIRIVHLDSPEKDIKCDESDDETNAPTFK